MRNCADAEIEVLIGTCAFRSALTSGGTLFDCTNDIGSCKNSSCSARDSSSSSDPNFFTSDGLRRSVSKSPVLVPPFATPAAALPQAHSAPYLSFQSPSTALG